SLLLTAQLLIVVAAALVTSRERLCHINTRILMLEVLDLSRHLTHHLIIFFTACPGMQRRLESESIKLFVVSEVLTHSRIVLALRVAQADPPLFAGSIDRLRSLCLQQFAQER